VDEATTQLLEEHVIMTQSMAFSPYKAPFEDRIVRWEAQLSMASEVVESWLTVQRAWMYLEPIFTSPDIMQQLPVEGKRFATVDRTWRKTQEAARRTPKVLRACSSRKLLTALNDCNKMLDLVQKGLSTYLEAKRLAFSRWGTHIAHAAPMISAIEYIAILTTQRASFQIAVHKLLVCNQVQANFLFAGSTS
jgi:dynein heavy chain, axonemal